MYLSLMATTRGKIMESERMNRLKECELIGCLNDSGVTSENYKNFLNQPDSSKREDCVKISKQLPDYPRCNCSTQMRCSGHCGNTVREVQ